MKTNSTHYSEYCLCTSSLPWSSFGYHLSCFSWHVGHVARILIMVTWAALTRHVTWSVTMDTSPAGLTRCQWQRVRVRWEYNIVIMTMMIRGQVCLPRGSGGRGLQQGLGTQWGVSLLHWALLHDRDKWVQLLHAWSSRGQVMFTGWGHGRVWPLPCI